MTDIVLTVLFMLIWTFFVAWFAAGIAWDRGWHQGFDEAATTIKEAIASNTARTWEKRRNDTL